MDSRLSTVIIFSEKQGKIYHIQARTEWQGSQHRRCLICHFVHYLGNTAEPWLVTDTRLKHKRRQPRLTHTLTHLILSLCSAHSSSSRIIIKKKLLQIEELGFWQDSEQRDCSSKITTTTTMHTKILIVVMLRAHWFYIFLIVWKYVLRTAVSCKQIENKKYANWDMKNYKKNVSFKVSSFTFPASKNALTYRFNF